MGGRAGEGTGLSIRNRTGRAEGRRQKAKHRDLCRETQSPRAPRGWAGAILTTAPAPSYHPLPPADHPGARLFARASPGSGPSPALEGATAFTNTSAAAAPKAAQAKPRREHRAPRKECTTPGAALYTDRARRAQKNGHCRYYPVAERESGREGVRYRLTRRCSGGGGGVGPGLARPRSGGAGRTESRGLRVGRAAPRVLRAFRVLSERP